MGLKDAMPGGRITARTLRELGRVADAAGPIPAFGSAGSTRRLPGGFGSVNPDTDWALGKVTGTVTGGYSFTEQWVDTTGAVVLLPGGRVGDVNTPGVSVSGTLATNDYVLFRRAHGAGNLKWELAKIGGGGVTGWFARLTTSSTNGGTWNPARWKYFRQTLNGSGAWADDGLESAAFDAVPSTIDGTEYCNPAAGLRVWMVPSQQAGLNEFLPTGYAAFNTPGLVSDTTQTISGFKTFANGAGSSGSGVVAMMPGPSTATLPTAFISTPLSYFTAAPTAASLQLIDHSNISTNRICGSFQLVGGLGRAELWLIPSPNLVDGGSGFVVGAGPFASYHPGDGKVYVGESGTLGVGGTVLGGIVTSLGNASAPVPSGFSQGDMLVWSGGTWGVLSRPFSDGTYTLQCVVSGGFASLAWV